VVRGGALHLSVGFPYSPRIQPTLSDLVAVVVAVMGSSVNEDGIEVVTLSDSEVQCRFGCMRSPPIL
jgi:hypothetical protein